MGIEWTQDLIDHGLDVGTLTQGPGDMPNPLDALMNAGVPTIDVYM